MASPYLVLAFALILSNFVCIIYSDSIPAENPGRRISLKERCDQFGDVVFFQEKRQRCILKVGNGKGIPYDFLQTGKVVCPEQASSFGYRAGEDTMTGYCGCEKNFVPSTDFKSCMAGKLFNQSCSTVPCNRDAGLECRNATKTCHCRHKGAVWNGNYSLCYSNEDCSDRKYRSYYDTDAEQCFIPLNDAFCDEREQRDFMLKELEAKQANSQHPGQFLHAGQALRFVKAIAALPQCPPNSHCIYNTFSSGSGTTCKCKPGFGPDEATGRKCVPVKLFGEECADDGNSTIQSNRCDRSNGLICTNGFCECRAPRKWEARSAACRVPVGHSCSSDSYSSQFKCGQNSQCIPQEQSYSYSYNSVTSYKCECNTGFKSVDGFCYVNYGDKCRFSNDCLPGMSCVDGTCRCAKSLSQKVSTDKRSCISLVGAPCDPLLQEQLTAHAICVNGTSTCLPGFRESRTGECFVPHGAQCTVHGTTVARCNFQEGLACIDGTCACIDQSARYKENMGCVAGVGSRCGKVFPLENCELQECRDEKYEIRCEHPATCNTVTEFISRCEKQRTP